MSANRGGQWAMHEEHNVGPVLDAYAADVTVVKAGTAYTTQGASIDVSGASVVAIVCECTGEALADDDVVFYIEASIDGTTWSSEGDASSALPYAKITVKSKATTQIQKLTLLDVRGVHYIRVDQMTNADASNDCTANVHFSVVK